MLLNPYKATFTHIRTLSTTFWVVIGATLMNQTGNMALVFLVLYLSQHLGFNLTHASSAFAAFSIAMLLSGLWGGSWINKFGAVRVMIGSLFANGITLLLMPFIHTYFIIIVMCLAWGFFYGLYRPASQTFVSSLSTPGMYKITFSVYRLAINLGMSIGPAIGGYLAYHSFATIFIANGIANLLAVTILLMGLFNTPWFKRTPASKKSMGLNMSWLKHDSAARLFLLGMIPSAMVFFQYESTLAVFLTHDLHFPLTFYGFLFTLNTLLIVVCELPLNIATIQWPYRLNFLVGSVLITLGFAGLFFASLQWHVILLTMAWTFGEMILYPSANGYMAEIAPEADRGSYLSIFSTCTNLGMLLGPWAGAIIMEYFNAEGLWFTCSLWGMLSIMLFYFIKNPKSREIV